MDAVLEPFVADAPKESTSYTFPGIEHEPQHLPSATDVRILRTYYKKVPHFTPMEKPATLPLPGSNTLFWFSGEEAQPTNAVIHALPVAFGFLPKTDLQERVGYALHAEQIENGVSHPAEDLLLDSIERDPAQTFDWIHSLLDFPSAPTVLAGVIACAGRLPAHHFKTHAEAIITHALRHSHPEVREAAISAVEQWESKPLLRVLRAHSDPIPWLDRYAQGVVDDVSG